MLVGSVSNSNSDQAAAIAEAIVKVREVLMKSSMSPEEISAVLSAYAGRPTVELVKPIEVWSDGEIEHEAARREMSWLSLESDDDLLHEVERRELSTVKASLSEEEFEREAEKRGFRNSLAQFPIEEIQTYMRIQGHGGSGGHGGGGGGSSERNLTMIIRSIGNITNLDVIRAICGLEIAEGLFGLSQQRLNEDRQ